MHGLGPQSIVAAEQRRLCDAACNAHAQTSNVISTDGGWQGQPLSPAVTEAESVVPQDPRLDPPTVHVLYSMQWEMRCAAAL